MSETTEYIGRKMAARNSLVIRNVRILDPVAGRDEIGDLAIVDGRFSDPPSAATRNLPQLDARGLAAAPGLIDMHVHLREPGQTEKEDIASGTQAAARGGFTTIVAMPNTVPVLDSVAAVEDLRERCRQTAAVRVLPCPALTLGQQGRDLTDFKALKDAGAVALSEDGKSLADPCLMRQAMLEARACGLPIVDHCEDPALAGIGVMHEGAVSHRLGLPGKPRSSEDLMVARDIVLAAETGCAIHLQHLSSGLAVALLEWASRQGLPVSGEATPHHLLLTDQQVARSGSNAKMNPPLREAEDREALCRAVESGTIEAIATDHAPHTLQDKEKPFDRAPAGVIGLETALGLCLQELHWRRGMPLLSVLSRFTSGPRRILGLEQGTLAVGEAADLILFDPEEGWTVDPETMVSKARNTPFAGFACRGRIKMTMLAGECVFRNPSINIR